MNRINRKIQKQQKKKKIIVKFQLQIVLLESNGNKIKILLYDIKKLFFLLVFFLKL